MGEKLPPKEMELYRRVDEILHYLWDPIGVAGAPGARDEYNGYLPTIHTLVRKAADQQEIADHLMRVERVNMGLNPKADRALQVAETLLLHREWIDRESS